MEISRIPADKSQVGFQHNSPEMQLRYEAFEAGNEYVGPDAAEADEWISELFASLLREWPKAKGKSEVVLIELEETQVNI